jgi:hypothetical protein
MLTSMCSALIDTPVSPGTGSSEDTTDQLVKASDAYVPVADADASVDVSSVITQYLGPNQPGVAAAKWQQVKLQVVPTISSRARATLQTASPRAAVRLV